MAATDKLYFHSVALIKLDRFHEGRIVLTGDAAWAVKGRGTTLALIGPYVLAGELARTRNLAAALANYDTIRGLRPST